jgi:hemoglobin-like flavoprotein
MIMNSLVRTIKASLNRTVVSKHFFDRFYDAFITSHPDVARLFANTDMAAQKVRLHHGLVQGLAYLDGKSFAKDTMERLRVSHGPDGMNIPPELYNYWRQSLLKVVKDTDPKYTPEVEKAWEEYSQIIVNAISGNSEESTKL